MNVRWLTTRAVFLLLAFPTCSANALPQHSAAFDTRLRFGQSVALSDFDDDGLIDEARLDAYHFHKRVGILLSRTGKVFVLNFDTKRPHRGSLFAKDVDSDGTTDLVWSDLLHADDVVVWLGDGSGGFERAQPSSNGDEFTLGYKSVNAPDEEDREPAINFESNRQLDQPRIQKCIDWASTERGTQHYGFVFTLSPALSQPADRGPPDFLA